MRSPAAAVAQPSLTPLALEESIDPITPASVLDADDASGVSRRSSGAAGSEGASPAVSDAFLSQLFGEEAQKIFQPFL